jgi:RNA polymerase sigma-70 factor (ECF subfamily)
MTELQFEKLFKEHFAYLSNVAFAMVKDEDDSYDIVQQVFVKFWDKRFDVDIDDNIKAYLHRQICSSDRKSLPCIDASALCLRML